MKNRIIYAAAVVATMLLAGQNAQAQSVKKSNPQVEAVTSATSQHPQTAKKTVKAKTDTTTAKTSNGANASKKKTAKRLKTKRQKATNGQKTASATSTSQDVTVRKSVGTVPAATVE